MVLCIASSDPRLLQGGFSTLVGLFDRVGLKTNVSKTVGMVCRLCQAEGTHSETAYGSRMTKSGNSYRKRQQVRIQRKEYREEMALGLLEGNMQTQHGEGSGGETALGIHRHRWGTAYIQDGIYDRRGTAELSHWVMSRTSSDKDGDAGTFFHRHIWDTVIILEEGNLPQQRCPRCDMLVPWRAFNGRPLPTLLPHLWFNALTDDTNHHKIVFQRSGMVYLIVLRSPPPIVLYIPSEPTKSFPITPITLFYSDNTPKTEISILNFQYWSLIDPHWNKDVDDVGF